MFYIYKYSVSKSKDLKYNDLKKVEKVKFLIRYSNHTKVQPLKRSLLVYF